MNFDDSLKVLAKSERLVLYGARTENSQRAAIALVEAGVVFEAAKLTAGCSGPIADRFLGQNPLTEVPVLAAYNDQEVVWSLSQWSAIMMDAAASAPGRLLPAQRSDERRALERFFYFLTDVIAPSHAGRYLDREGVQDGAKAMTALTSERIERCESFLEYGPYMAGEAFGLADIAAYTLIHAVPQDLHWKYFPLLTDWYARVEARPGVRWGMAAFGE
ncbi:glutathione S-transferase family protein [Dyella halodurans]|uniref:Glutathione S-transferase family protein n=1 Tax=Dyella halodurans TaxID=1920171 RepID=A0ABV9C257_9GAMM|nr:glutathione S-transferase family protein [Dyella halodurans]